MRKLLFLLLLIPAADAQIAPGLPADTLACNPTGAVGPPTYCTLGTNLSFSSNVLNATGGGGGLTSVGLADTSTVPIYTVGNSPLTANGTLNLTLNSETANFFFAAPNGAPGQPGFRAIVAADIPTLNQSTTGTAAGLSASPNITVGTVSTSGLITTNLTGQTANTAVNAGLFENTTTAAAASQQYACIQLTGQGWKTNATAASQSTDWQICNEPVQAAATPATTLVLQAQSNGGGYTTYATFGSSATSPAFVIANNTAGIQAEGYRVTSGGSAATVPNGIYLAATSTLGLSANSTAVAQSTSTLWSDLVPHVSAGTVYTIASGTGACATTSTKVGGAVAGNFTCTGTTGAATVTLTLAAVTTGYVCTVRDVTTVADTGAQTGAVSTTSVTFTFAAVASSDVIQFGCMMAY